MDLPEEVIELRESIIKQARKKGEVLWKKARELKARQFQEEKNIPTCANCGIRGHSHEVHVKTASLYEIIGGRIGCKEEFITHPTAQQWTARAVLSMPKARHWHKQPSRRKNRGYLIHED